MNSLAGVFPLRHARTTLISLFPLSRFELLSTAGLTKSCLIFDERRLMKGIRRRALLMTREWCIKSLNMHMYITWAGTCPMVCHIDLGMNYAPPAIHMKNISRGGLTSSPKSYWHRPPYGFRSRVRVGLAIRTYLPEVEFAASPGSAGVGVTVRRNRFIFAT